MTITQFLRIVWARKWLAVGLMVLVSIVGSLVTVNLPKRYTAETSLIVEMRVDPVLGMMAPSLVAPGYIATQVDVLKSERVAARVVKLLRSRNGVTRRKRRSRLTATTRPCCRRA